MHSPTKHGRTAKIWRDGQLIPWDDANVHVMSHVVHYGSSIFEGLRFYETPQGPAIFRLEDHMRRLHDSCKIYRMPMRHSVEALAQGCVETVAANDIDKGYLRPVVLRTGEQMGVNPTDVPVETFIIAWHWGRYLGEDAIRDGVDTCVSTWRRAAPDTFPTLAKAGGNYLNSQLSKAEAKLDKYAEGIMLDSQGYVAEGSGENIFVARRNVLFTPPLSSDILEGITRDSVMTIARDLGYEVRTEALPRELLYIADEIFFSGTAAEITPVRSVDHVPVGEGRPGPMTRAIQDRFMGIATGKVADKHGWLTVVPAAVAAR